ncbi:MAG: phospho-N-acetylmuramoyl-pentapeptide-transferase [Bacillota bacterium]
MVTFCISMLMSFFVVMFLCPAYISLMEKVSAKQTILSYVEQHKEKEGVPTMGGLVFLIATLAVSLIMGGYSGELSVMFLAVMVGYGIIGFLDDFIKIKLKRNLGLKAYQKIISQLAVATIAAYFAYKNSYVGTVIALPFSADSIDLGVWYMPFAIILFIAMSNAVNLTDGLDGLASTTNIIYFGTFMAIIGIMLAEAINNGNTIYIAELKSLGVCVSALIGSLIAFLWFNSHKAKIFMGDVGSLALGASAGMIGLLTKNPLISALVGIMFVVSVVSVIVQVVSYKTRKKRVFLMAPFHHHLELKGHNESKIVSFYGITTFIAAVVSLIII